MSNHYEDIVKRLRGYAAASTAVMLTAEQITSIADAIEEQQLALKAHHELAVSSEVDVDQLIHELHTLGAELVATPELRPIGHSLAATSVVVNNYRREILVSRVVRWGIEYAPEPPTDPQAGLDPDCCQ